MVGCCLLRDISQVLKTRSLRHSYVVGIILQISFEQGKEPSFSQQRLDSAGYLPELSIVKELFRLGMKALHIFQETTKALAHLDFET